MLDLVTQDSFSCVLYIYFTVYSFSREHNGQLVFQRAYEELTGAVKLKFEKVKRYTTRSSLPIMEFQAETCIILLNVRLILLNELVPTLTDDETLPVRDLLS